MADISKINLNNTTYDLKDAQARIDLANKQDSLVSGTNIKTINNTSLLGSGNIDIEGGSDVFKANYNVTPYTEVKDALESKKAILVYTTNNSNVFQCTYAQFVGASGTDILLHSIYKSSEGDLNLSIFTVKTDNTWSVAHTKLQDKLVSGTNIKTINNTSLLGSGNINIEGAEPNIDSISVNGTLVAPDSSKNVDLIIPTKTSDLTNDGEDGTSTYVSFSDVATNSDYGLVKLNSTEGVTLNTSGQLDVGGRLGQFSTTTGIFHSKDREPRSVGDFSFLITDAKGMYLSAPRDFALVTGVNLALTGSHPAGSSTYTVKNTYANRIACAVLANGGYLSQNEAYSKENSVVPVASVKINGSNYIPDSSADSSSTPITITTVNNTSANPTSAVTQLRVFGGITGGYCSEYIGQCVGGSVGASLVIGQRVFSSNNVNCIVAADVYNTGNGSAIFGRQHINKKNRAFLAGTGHDTSNARSESVSALGEWSDLSSTETLFAIGDGTAHTARSNAFEVRDQCIVLKSPNGTKWKITVDNSGNLITTQTS